MKINILYNFFQNIFLNYHLNNYFFEHKNKKITIENEELKIELENYKKKLESSLQLLEDKDNLIIKLQKITKEKTQNESKESFSDITTDDKSYKKNL